MADDVAANYGIIPMPNELAPMQGVYVLQGEKTVAVPSGEAAMKVFHYLEDALKNTSVTLKGISETGKADICLSIDNSLPNEAYTLEVSSDRINISSNETAAGFFYGVQSLLQLMPAAIYDGDRKYEGKIRIPAVRRLLGMGQLALQCRNRQVRPRTGQEQHPRHVRLHQEIKTSWRGICRHDLC